MSILEFLFGGGPTEDTVGAVFGLNAIRVRRAIGSARVDCRHYEYDPMLRIERPDGFCQATSGLLKECEFMNDPHACPLNVEGLDQK
jgi:hypothetical protein